MLSLTKKTEYALIALGYLAERPDKVTSAREIAEAFTMPTALVMNILKALHHGGMLVSTRGTKGGYRLKRQLTQVSMHDLIQMLEGPIRLADCVVVDGECNGPEFCRIAAVCPIQGAIQSLHTRMVGFLRDVTLADILVPGQRIDVPVEMVGTSA